MKFRVASLLSLLSGIAFMDTPALGMEDLQDRGGPSSHVPSKPKKVLSAKRSNLKDFLSKQSYPEAFKALRENLSPTCSDEEIVDFLMTSNKYPEWDKVDPEDKTWVVTKIAKAAKRIELESFLSKQSYPEAFKALRETLSPTCSDEEIVDFLMTSNKYPEWDKVDPQDKRWVVDRITSEAHRLELDALLSQPDYSRVFRLITSFGRYSSDEGVARFLLESNGYQNWDRLSEDTRAWVVAKIKPPILDAEAEEMTIEKSFTFLVSAYRKRFGDFQTAIKEYAIQKGVPQKQVIFDQFGVIPHLNTALTLGVPLLESLLDVRAADLKFSSDHSASDSIEDVVRKCINATGLFNIGHDTIFFLKANIFQGPLAEEFYGIPPRLETIQQQEHEAFTAALKAGGLIETVLRYTVARERLSEIPYSSPDYKAAAKEMDFNYDVMLTFAKESGIPTPRTESEIQEGLYDEHPVFGPWYNMVKDAEELSEIWKIMKTNAYHKKMGAGKA
ncbi:MAG: hypothetical protein JSR85_05730 [Proteobacteria bacterium]|nr:hypothetical protein [Pseudomonadota bacterium]